MGSDTEHDSSTEADLDPIDFAILVPINAHARANFRAVTRKIHSQSQNYCEHHARFIRSNIPDSYRDDYSVAPVASQSRSPTVSFSSDDATRADEEEVEVGCYTLVLDLIRPPLRPEMGWVVGSGSWDRDKASGQVDIVLAEAPNVYPRHFYFHFDSRKRLQLIPRHDGVFVNGERVPKGRIRIMEYSCQLAVGELQYHFQFAVPRSEEGRFQAHKLEYLRGHGDAVDMSDGATSVTPAPHDRRIGGWMIHSIVGITDKTVVQTASDVRTGQVVAIKGMTRQDSRTAKRVADELSIYKAIKRCLKNDWRRDLVMNLHDVFNDEPWQPGMKDEVWLLWTPLAMFTFREFAVNRTHAGAARSVRTELFAQIALGLRALHEIGYVHRDVKPLNLYVVRLEPPHAIVGDLGGAKRCPPEGLIAHLGSCGTIGWLAPELENPHFAPTYNYEVDTWSLGAVGYSVLQSVGPSLPTTHGGQNIFRQEFEASWPDFQRVVHPLGQGRSGSIEHLLHGLLQPFPGERLKLVDALRHPALTSSVAACKKRRQLRGVNTTSRKRRGEVE